MKNDCTLIDARLESSMSIAISDCEIVASHHTYSARIRKQYERARTRREEEAEEGEEEDTVFLVPLLTGSSHCRVYVYQSIPLFSVGSIAAA